MFELKLEKFADKGLPVTSIAAADVVSSQANTPIGEVLELMLKRFRRIPILRKEEVVGLVTASDILDFIGGGPKCRFFKRKKMDTLVSRIMSSPITLKSQDPIENALLVFKKFERGAYPVLDEKKPVGMLAEWDFVNLINKRTGLRIGDLIMPKPFVVKENWPVRDVAKIMVSGGFRRLPVTKNNILTGIVTPRDILAHLAENKKLGKLEKEKTEIKTVMNTDVISVSPDADLYEAIKIMKAKGIGGLPVVEDPEVLGIITERDVVEVMK